MIPNDGGLARARILNRLKAARLKAAPAALPLEVGAAGARPAPVADRMARFRAMLEASHAVVIDVGPADWPLRLAEALTPRGVSRLLYAPGTDAGRALAPAWAGSAAPVLLPYDRPVEAMKPVLVSEAEAALTTARCGIARTGSLVLWPAADQPRLMSLLPPIHVVLVEAESLVDSLEEAMAVQNWAVGMPTNALLVSGPSKTADIEQTLAYGVHGPKELIVLVIRR